MVGFLMGRKGTRGIHRLEGLILRMERNMAGR